jgi:hypothetical protein
LADIRRRGAANAESRVGILPCPGLRGGLFTDSQGRRFDLAHELRKRPKEAAADQRLQGFSEKAIRRLITAGQLYPVFRRNARVIEIFDCAIADWFARQLPAIRATA